MDEDAVLANAPIAGELDPAVDGGDLRRDVVLEYDRRRRQLPPQQTKEGFVVAALSLEQHFEGAEVPRRQKATNGL